MSQFAYLSQARTQLFENHDAEAACQALAPSLGDKSLGNGVKRALYQLQGYAQIQLGQYAEASESFAAVKDWYQAGYALMLGKKLELAIPYWRKLFPLRENHWSLHLFGLLTHQLATMPTLLQIRNHLEGDVANLLIAGCDTYLNSLLDYASILNDINAESYKLIGRALLNHGELERAEPYLTLAQQSLPNDPEIYFHLGQLMSEKQAWHEAQVMLKQCLLISTTYTPAERLLHSIAAKIN